jgi:lipopolysaccharide/colanic/teichoic acid biosynthesis glycosyltransferase
MVADAEAQRAALEHLNEQDGPAFKIRRDPRITSVGRFIRKTSIDELPQLFNVMRGDMSLVGPRPALPSEVAEYAPWQRRRLSVKPGITGLWQVSGRNQVDFDEWMHLDLAYIDGWSLWLDLRILLRTIPVVLLRKGAS